MCRDRWMDKQKHIHNGILFSFKKECSSDTCYNMDEHWQYYTKWSQTQNDKYHMHLNEILREVKIMKLESRVVVARGWEEGEMGSEYFSDTEFPFGVMKKFWIVDGE